MRSGSSVGRPSRSSRPPSRSSHRSRTARSTSTIRHLLAHASGLTFDGDRVLAKPGTRRIYSNAGFDALGALLEARDGRPFAVALSDRVLAPLGMAGTEL